MNRASRCKNFLLLVTVWMAATLAARTQTFTTLTSFDYSNGSNPAAPPAQGIDGNFYGSTSLGGMNTYGTIFKITPQGDLSILYEFCALANCSDGAEPGQPLLLTTDGNFYGTTGVGGGSTACPSGCGTVFKLSPNGTLTTLHRFSFLDGYGPHGLIQGYDGALYGVTVLGGFNGAGTIFRMTLDGQVTTLYTFCSQAGCADGSYPSGKLLQGVDGSFYGVTVEGGTHICEGFSCGTVFRLSRSGKLTTLEDFDGTEGIEPRSGMIEGSDGMFYGVTNTTIFELTARGRLRTLHRFNRTEGGPSGPLVQATDGNLYGTSSDGGLDNCRYGCGTLFNLSTSGLATVYAFCPQQGCADGSFPEGGLIQSTTGLFYGTSLGFGANGYGTVYNLDMGLGPFVALVRGSGKVAAIQGILGQGFTGATQVAINGLTANFSVVSDTYLTATIPNGATTGFVTVTTPSGTLQSNVPFRVLPQLLSFDPPSGPPGTQVTITGVSLMQTLGVGFGDRTPAQFTVNSDTSVTATVPQGAKTGKIGIETKGGVAISSGTFEVTE